MNNKSVFLNRIILSIVALLVILFIGIGITFSWIEGGTTYTMLTEEDKDLKTEASNQFKFNGTVTLNPNTSLDPLALNTYDETSNKHQDLYFSPVSSVDGNNFFFPINRSGDTAAYREANTNDIGTKFINFDFDVKTTNKCYLAFNGKPTITATKSGDSNTTIDTSAFRIMVANGTSSHIFTTSNTEKTTSAVKSINGTTATTQNLIAKPFTNYLNNPTTKANRLFTYEKNATDNIVISVWLESSDPAYTSLLGADISIDLNLIVVQDNVTATFDAVTYDRSGNKVTNGFTGGSITYGSDSYSEVFTKTGTTFTATAVPKTGYKFVGWYTNEACTSLATNETKLTVTPDSDKSYYAKFQEISKTTIYVEKRSGFSTYSVYAYRKVGSTTYHYTSQGRTTTDNWPGVTATLDSNTGFYKFEFETTDTGSFNVIVSNNGASQYPAQDQEGLVGTLGKTYLFTSDNKLEEFNPADMITFKTLATPQNYGTTYVNTKPSVKIMSGDSVSITASANEGYRFVGWYKDSTCTTTIGTTYATATQTIKITGTAGSTITYYAKFEKIPVLTVTTSVTPSGSGTATVNSSASVNVQTGKSVTLKATPASGYEFVGWYTNSACTDTIGDNYTSQSASYPVSGTDGQTITIYAKFKVESTTKKIYFTPNEAWKNDGARFACYVWTGSDVKWYSMGDGNSDGVYSVEIDKKYTDIIFCRMNPANTTNSWNTKWNQTSDLTIPTDSKNHFVRNSTAWDYGDSNDSWTTYSG